MQVVERARVVGRVRCVEADPYFFGGVFLWLGGFMLSRAGGRMIHPYGRRRTHSKYRDIHTNARIPGAARASSSASCEILKTTPPPSTSPSSSASCCCCRLEEDGEQAASPAPVAARWSRRGFCPCFEGGCGGVVIVIGVSG